MCTTPSRIKLGSPDQLARAQRLDANVESVKKSISSACTCHLWRRLSRVGACLVFAMPAGHSLAMCLIPSPGCALV